MRIDQQSSNLKFMITTSIANQKLVSSFILRTKKNSQLWPKEKIFFFRMKNSMSLMFEKGESPVGQVRERVKDLV